MEVFFYDPATPDRQRPWVSLLGRCAECQWDAKTAGFVTATSAPISDAIVVAHYSKFEENAISQGAIELFASSRKGSTVIVVYGGSRAWRSDVPNVYFRKTSVSYDSGDPFQRYFARFKKQLEDTGERAFQILDPDVPILTSIVIACQLYAAVGIANGRIANGAPLAKELGWGRLSDSTTSLLSMRLADQWPRLSQSKWWRSFLGIGTDDKGEPIEAEHRSVLARLSLELGGQPGTAIIDLLKGPSVTPSLVEVAWHQAKVLLEA